MEKRTKLVSTLCVCRWGLRFSAGICLPYTDFALQGNLTIREIKRATRTKKIKHYTKYPNAQYHSQDDEIAQFKQARIIQTIHVWCLKGNEIKQPSERERERANISRRFSKNSSGSIPRSSNNFFLRSVSVSFQILKIENRKFDNSIIYDAIKSSFHFSNTTTGTHSTSKR